MEHHHEKTSHTEAYATCDHAPRALALAAAGPTKAGPGIEPTTSPREAEPQTGTGAEADLSDPLNRLVVNNDEPLTAPVAPRPALQDLDWP